MKKAVAVFSLMLCLCLMNAHAAPTPHAGMKLINAAQDTFVMGFAPGVQNWACITGQHKVTFTYNFYVDSTLVTQGDYSTIMNYNPSAHTGNLRLPVETMTWFDAVLYCNARSKRDNLDTVYSFTAITKNGNVTTNLANLTFTAANLKKNGYRLLTNAEAEYCVRSHNPGMWWWTTTTSATQATTDAANYVVYSGNDGGTTQPVASKKPDSFGLYDMTGNVFEWENDWEAPYVTTPQVDPIGAAASNAPACTTWDDGPNQKMVRGGSYKDDCNYHGRTPYHFKWTITDRHGELGFRCAATAPTTGTDDHGISTPDFSWLTVTPGRGSAKIDYSMESQGLVSIAIFDCRGIVVRDLVSGSLPAGKHSATWDGKSASGIKAGAGAYVVSVKVASRSFAKTIVIEQ